MLLAALVVNGLTVWWGPETMAAWGWRVPFLLAAPIGVVGLYLRNRMEDTPEFQGVERRHEVADSPLLEALRSQRVPMAVFFGVTVACVVCLGMLLTFLTTYLQQVGLPPRQALLSNAIAVATFAALCPVAGRLSDRVGRKPMLLAGSIGCAVLGVPIFLLLSAGTFGGAVLGQLVLVVPLVLLGPIMIAVLVELFPTRLRYSAASISYNVVQAVFGGTTALVSVWLISRTGSPVAPGWYLAVLGVVSTVVVVAAFRETAPRA
jgi:MFS transporter, MHS family, proline/betaine transporter